MRTLQVLLLFMVSTQTIHAEKITFSQPSRLTTTDSARPKRRVRTAEKWIAHYESSIPTESMDDDVEVWVTNDTVISVPSSLLEKKPLALSKLDPYTECTSPLSDKCSLEKEDLLQGIKELIVWLLTENLPSLGYHSPPAKYLIRYSKIGDSKSLTEEDIDHHPSLESTISALCTINKNVFRAKITDGSNMPLIAIAIGCEKELDESVHRATAHIVSRNALGQLILAVQQGKNHAYEDILTLHHAKCITNDDITTLAIPSLVTAIINQDKGEWACLHFLSRAIECDSSMMFAQYLPRLLAIACIKGSVPAFMLARAIIKGEKHIDTSIGTLLSYIPGLIAQARKQKPYVTEHDHLEGTTYKKKYLGHRHAHIILSDLSTTENPVLIKALIDYIPKLIELRIKEDKDDSGNVSVFSFLLRIVESAEKDDLKTLFTQELQRALSSTRSSESILRHL